VSKTPGRTHQDVISLDAIALNTRSGVAASSTDASSCPFAASATARAVPLISAMSCPPEDRDRAGGGKSSAAAVVTSFVETTQVAPTSLEGSIRRASTRFERKARPCGCAQPAQIAV
jgi:hypothetical protein